MDHATHALRFHPGTDVALLNAMLHTIVTEGLIDRAAIAAHVDGYDAFVLTLAAYSADAMAEVTGVPAETIRTAARAFATAKAALLFWGMGISQSTPGTDKRALPDRAGLDHWPDWPTGDRPASVARAKQRPGCVRCRPDSDGLPRLCGGGLARAPCAV